MTNLMKTNSQNEMVHSAKRFFARCWWVLAVLMFANFASIQAQQTTGSIVGTVKDQTGAVVNNATVKATNADTGYSRVAPTNGYGEYRIDYLPVGKYAVEVSAAGFERFVQQNFTLTVDQTLTLDVAMTVGIQSQTVTVTSAPPLVNTSDAVLGRTIELDEITDLPLVNRNVYAELSLTPGVMANSMSPTSQPRRHPQYDRWTAVRGYPGQRLARLRQRNGRILSGWRQQHYRYAQLRQPVSQPRRTEEFSVETNAFQAQYGQFSGAVVTVVTKSGNNKFHGELYRVQPQHRLQRL